MALRLVLGGAGTGKTARCLSEMQEGLRKSAEGHSLVMILPEHATFKTEKLIASAPGLAGFTRGSVFGFRRLAHRILMETGGALRPRVTEIGKRLLLSKVLLARGKELKALGKAARQRNFTQSLVEMIEEFKSYRIQADRLAEASAGIADSPLKDKLEDLASIYRGFEDAMVGRYNDGEDCLDLAAARLGASEMLRGAEVWVDGFAFFNPQETAFLREILRAAKTVTVTLCIDDADHPRHRADTSPFHRQWKTREKLCALADSLAIALTEEKLREKYRFAAGALRHLEENLFRFPPGRIDGGAAIHIAEAANRRLEVEGAAADMIRLCREEGYRWRDIGVLVRDAENYEALLETVFADYNIPFFSDKKRRSIHHPLAELVRSSLEAINGWKYEPLFRAFKTDFFDASREEIDLLENYVLQFGIRGKRWRMEEDWNYVKRLSIEEDEEPDEEAAERLEQINAIRRQVIAPLLTFAQGMKAARNVERMTRALYALLVELRVPEKLESWALGAEDRGMLDEAREHQQLWDGVVELFDQLVETSGSEKLSAEAYESLLGEGLESLTLSLIPPGLDYVTIASFDQNSLDNAAAIYVVGVNEGALPKRAHGEGLLTDAERARMADMGLELAAGASGDNFSERFLIYAGLTRASRYMWISYPLADSEGGGLHPSPIIRRVRDMLGGARLDSLPLTAGDARPLIARPRQAVSRLAGALRDYKRKQALHPLWHDVYNWALAREDTADMLQSAVRGLFHSAKVLPLPPKLAERLYTKNKRLKGSVTRFEQFHACPFQHFAAYGLSLKERAEFRFEAPDLGRFLHAALKKFGDRMRQAGRDWGSVSDAEYPAICEEIVNDLAPRLQNEILLSSARYQHLLGRIRRTVERSVHRLIAFDRVSAFKPVGLEKSFGRGKGALPPLTYALDGGCRLEITGQIDRVDCADAAGRRYFLIIDYKSGNAYLNLIDVYYGLKLQLITYLLVAENAAKELLGGPAVPAGVLYCFLKNPVLSEKRRLPEKEAVDKLNSLLRMPGWILADADMIRLIDSSFRFVKVSVTTKGAIHAASKNSVKTEDEFAALLAYINRILADTGRQILNGDVAVSPYALDAREPCGFCRFASVCQFDRTLPEHDYRRLKNLSNDEIMRVLAAETTKWKQ